MRHEPVDTARKLVVTRPHAPEALLKPLDERALLGRALAGRLFLALQLD
jgi:hypothetical protein